MVVRDLVLQDHVAGLEHPAVFRHAIAIVIDQQPRLNHVDFALATVAVVRRRPSALRPVALAGVTGRQIIHQVTVDAATDQIARRHTSRQVRDETRALDATGVTRNPELLWRHALDAVALARLLAFDAHVG